MPINPEGILTGLVSFLIIGLFHPIVIKCEYCFSAKIWPLFLLMGLLLLTASLFAQGFLSLVLGLTGFACLWSIHELKEQERRVKKGWFPKREKKR